MKRGLAVASALAALACGAAQPPGPLQPTAPAPPRPGPEHIALSLFLIGDTGKPAKDGEPVLISLRRDLTAAGAPTTVVFLGDNLYPAGLPAPGAGPEVAEMERRLDTQLDAVRDTGARVVFIPGNHDWAKGGQSGRKAVRREEGRVESRGGPAVSFMPTGACPGPELADVSDRLRLVAIDTNWWLGARLWPGATAPECTADTEAEVVAGLREALAGAGGRDVVLVGHHPLLSGGSHGGHFTLRQHLFPLTELKSRLWLPLPLVGSIYPLARQSGVSTQDQSSREYRHMRDALHEAATAHPPLAWASGHEHALQVIESAEWGRVLVSGGGIYGHEGHVEAVPGSLYEASNAGYMRIDFLRDGTRRLGVVEAAQDGSSRESFAKAIEPVVPR